MVYSSLLGSSGAWHSIIVWQIKLVSLTTMSLLHQTQGSVLTTAMQCNLAPWGIVTGVIHSCTACAISKRVWKNLKTTYPWVVFDIGIDLKLTESDKEKEANFMMVARSDNYFPLNSANTVQLHEVSKFTYFSLLGLFAVCLASVLYEKIFKNSNCFLKSSVGLLELASLWILIPTKLSPLNLDLPKPCASKIHTRSCFHFQESIFKSRLQNFRFFQGHMISKQLESGWVHARPWPRMPLDTELSLDLFCLAVANFVSIQALKQTQGWHHWWALHFASSTNFNTQNSDVDRYPWHITLGWKHNIFRKQPRTPLEMILVLNTTSKFKIHWSMS